MSDSDDSRKWPQADRRSTADRRQKGDRRTERRGSAAARKVPPKSDRRKTQRRTARERRDESAWQPMPVDGGLPAGFAGREELLAAAAAARELAHAHFSGFKVGAALETLDGTIITGCNIENASYGLTLCAERVALVKALSDGHTAFTGIAIVADVDRPTPPCGPCRQLLWEYCGDIDVILGNLQTVTGEFRLAALLPLPFDRGLLR